MKTPKEKASIHLMQYGEEGMSEALDIAIKETKKAEREKMINEIKKIISKMEWQKIDIYDVIRVAELDINLDKLKKLKGEE